MSSFLDKDQDRNITLAHQHYGGSQLECPVKRLTGLALPNFCSAFSKNSAMVSFDGRMYLQISIIKEC